MPKKYEIILKKSEKVNDFRELSFQPAFLCPETGKTIAIYNNYTWFYLSFKSSFNAGHIDLYLVQKDTIWYDEFYKLINMNDIH
jgi:hypothetical protein